MSEVIVNGTMNHSSLNGTREDPRGTCLARIAAAAYENHNGTNFENGCGIFWDGFNCWGPASPGSFAYLACPAAKGMDITKQAYRYCDKSGQWLNKDGIPDDRGWTNYTPCFTPEILALIQRLYSGTESEALTKIEIARKTRILEIFGLSCSLVALLLSLFVFCYFRSLRNTRTKLHRNLFVAMVIQVAVRLTLYIDQFIVRSTLDVKASVQDSRGIDNTPILCEAAYICLEYARTAMFMWMFVEGLYLHNMVTVTVFEERLSPIYPFLGWILPIPLTLCWAIVTARQYGSATCWWGYNFTWYFWILEGPRLGVLVVNLAFLLNILRVLVTKLRQSSSSETHQARKAVKAALVLLPLLGLTNFLNIMDAPLERSVIEFGIWSYTTHTLTSCQGFILAFLYCFWNGEVQLAVKKFVRYRIFHGSGVQCFGSTTGRASHGGTIVDEANHIELANGCSKSHKSHLVRVQTVRRINMDEYRKNNSSVTDKEESQTRNAPPTPNTETYRTSDENEIFVDDILFETAGSIQPSTEKEKVGPVVVNKGERKLSRLSRLRIWMSPLILANQKTIFIEVPGRI